MAFLVREARLRRRDEQWSFVDKEKVGADVVRRRHKVW
jgi:hypothetical protein